jgi:hypothetical protein
MKSSLPLRSMVFLCLPSLAIAQALELPLDAAIPPMPPLHRVYPFDVFPAGTSPMASAARTQILVSATDVGTAPRTFTSLAFRPSDNTPSGWANGLGGYTANIEIKMSWSPLPPSAASPQFDLNHVTPAVTVYQGPLSLSERAPQPFPAAWETPIGFQTPFAYPGATSGSLVIDIEVSSPISQPGAIPWFVEQYAENQGWAALLHPSCAFPAIVGSRVPGVNGPAPRVGGLFNPHYVDYPPAGVQDLLGTYQVYGFGLQQPLLVSALGAVPVEPSCAVGLSLWGTTPSVLVYGSPFASLYEMELATPQPVPNLAALAGLTFATQSFSLWRNQAVIEFHMGPTAEWTIRPARLGGESMVVHALRAVAGISHGTRHFDAFVPVQLN